MGMPVFTISNRKGFSFPVHCDVTMVRVWINEVGALESDGCLQGLRIMLLCAV